jgi:hypothetical protein
VEHIFFLSAAVCCSLSDQMGKQLGGALHITSQMQIALFYPIDFEWTDTVNLDNISFKGKTFVIVF